MPGRVIPGDFQADQYQNIWSLWWVKHSLIDHPANPFFTPFVFYPDGSPLYLHALDLLGGLLALPVTLLAGPIAAFSLLCILSLALTGLAAMVLGYTLSGSRFGGLVAGYALTFGVIHFNYVGLGQLEFVSLWPLLFYLSGLSRLLYRLPASFEPSDFGRQLWQARWTLVGTVASLLAGAFVTLYYVAYAALFSLFLLIFRLVQLRRLGLMAIVVSRVGLVWLAFSGLFGPFALKVLAEKRAGQTDLSAPYQVVIDQSVAVHSYFSQFSGNTMLGQLLGLPRSAPLNVSHYLGFSFVILALVGLILGRGRLWPWLLSAVIFASLSYGPAIRWQDEPEPPAIAPQSFMPWNWLHGTPLLSLTNNPMRFELLVAIGLSVLVACGVGELVRRWRGSLSVRWVGGLLLAGLVLESAGLPLTTPISVPPEVSVVQDDCARIKCGEAAVLDLPFSKDHYLADADMMLWGALRQKPLLGGYLSRRISDPYDPESSPFRLFRQLTPLQDIFSPGPNDSVLQILNYYNIRYLTVSPPEYGRIYSEDILTLNAFLEKSLGQTARIYDTPTLQVYRVPPLKPDQTHPFVIVGDGWYKAEAEQLPKRWARRVATFDVYAFGPGETQLSLEATAFGQTRAVNLSVNGQALGRVDVPAGRWQPFDFKLPLRAGQNTVGLEPIDPPQSPAALDPSSKDTRFISIAVRQVRVF